MVNFSIHNGYFFGDFLRPPLIKAFSKTTMELNDISFEMDHAIIHHSQIVFSIRNYIKYKLMMVYQIPRHTFTSTLDSTEGMYLIQNNE